MDDISNYKKFLMNRVTITQPLIEFIENCLSSEDEAMKHSFHKIMIHNWMDGPASTQLFEALIDYFGVTFVPVHCETQNSLTTFYTCSLNFILKIIKLDFMFPHARSMVNIDILFNDKNSIYFFKRKVTIDDIVSRVVSLRFKENLELNLSNFINDEEFTQKNIHFYKLSLLAHFKLLMIRMGRDTRILNLSNNNLSQVPLEILNFFIKGDLIEVNLSNNKIRSISELHRISSKIEKLWVEGNPLCENMEPMAYIKQLSLKFPRLTELDGVKLNEHGLMIPFYNNFLVVTDKKTKMIIEKFVSLYFAHYDTLRSKLEEFYDEVAYLTISHTFTDAEESIESLHNYVMHSRNILNPKQKEWNFKFRRIYKKKAAIISVLSQLPRTTHDPRTFTVDVLRHDNKVLTVIFEGVYKEHLKDGSERFMHFRRTFMFDIYSVNTMSFYKIVHEMFSVSFATPEMINSSFQHPVRHLNQLTLINPDKEERDVLCTAFIHYTQLKKSEAEARLLYHDWDLRQALKAFTQDLKNNRISDDKMIVDEDISDISSLLDDDVD